MKNKFLLVVLTIYLVLKIVGLTNIADLVFWGLILIYLIFYIKEFHVRFHKNRKYFVYMVIISSINSVAFFYLGFIFGFLKNPYINNINLLFKNIIIKIIPIISIEFSRNIILTRNRENKFLIVIVTLLFILLEINYNTVIDLFSDREELFEYVCKEILPIISCGILYTYLTLQGSYSLPLTYRIFKELTIIMLPVIPDLDWFAYGSLFILSPTIIYFIFKYKFVKSKKDIRKRRKLYIDKITYGITIILSITLICFMLGFFKYEPITILSNSMNPALYKADVVIYKKLNDTELEKIPVGSIIIYTIGDQNIAHRVIDRIDDSRNILYKTKGDSNNVADTNLVKTNQIKGVYVFYIRYIGFPSVWLYNFLNQK